MSFPKMSKKVYLFIFVALVLLSCAIIAGVRQPSPTEEAAPKLQISVAHDYSAYTTEEFPHGMDDTSSIEFCCNGVADVTIDLDGTVMDIGSAIRENLISFGEIFSLVQQDTQAGFCTESWKSKNELVHFCYSYPDFDLWFTNDIYDTPDGLQHLIRDLCLSQPGDNVIFVYSELDQEDWGIEFSVVEASSSEITLAYTQSGGQIIGRLMTCGYEISNLDRREGLSRLEGSGFEEQMPISMNAHDNITLDISTYFGPLPAGHYGMYLTLQDQYEEEDMPLLTRNYHDMQCYWIPFTVPSE